jgi:flagellin
MPVTLSTNPAQTTAARALEHANRDLTASLKRLSTGNRIANIYDDAGGEAVQLKLKAQSDRYGALQNNLQNGISFLQVQEGVLTTATDAASRLGELVAMAEDPTKSAADVDNYEVESAELGSLLTRLAAQQFNGNALFGSTKTLNLNVQSTPDTMTISDEDLSGAVSLLTANASDLTTSGLTAANVESSLQQLANLKAQVGAKQSTLNYYYDNASLTQANINAARGRITDVDIASEASAYAISQVKSQAAAAMLSQANKVGTQNLMQLLL